MKIPFGIINDEKDNPIVYTLTHSNKFFYIKLTDLINYKDEKIIIVVKDTRDEELKELIKKFKNSKCVFLIPKKHSQKFEKEKLKTIIYPLRPDSIIKIFLTNEKIAKNNFGLLLKNNGLLFNEKNNMSTYLTETETAIIESLFKKNVIDKNTIKEKILRLHKSIDSKSLESHLSRIRKKIKTIKSSTEIISINLNQIKIKSTDQ